MNTLFSIIFVILLTPAFTVLAQKNDPPKIPNQIEKMMEENDDLSSKSDGYVAYGIAVGKDGKKYYWYSFLNSDFFYQFRFSRNISPNDSSSISKISDGLKRPYESIGSWVGASNDWCFSEYSKSTSYKRYTGKYIDHNGKKQREYYEISSLCAATTKYTRALKKVFKKFEVIQVNPRIVKEEYSWILK